MHRPAAVLAVLSVVLAAPATASAPPDGSDLPAADGVRFVAVPAYLPIRIASSNRDGIITGRVTVDVVVDSGGSAVEEATVVDAPALPFIGAWARAAALEWEFEPRPASLSRSYRLTFSFEGETVSDSPRGVQTSYESPLTLHLVYNLPSIRHLDRSSWGSSPPRCSVHHALMAIELLPIRYGLPAGISTTDPVYDLVLEYWDDTRRLFPNADESVGGGCVIGSETRAEVLVCPVCREVKRKWLRAHPDIPIRFYQ